MPQTVEAKLMQLISLRIYLSYNRHCTCYEGITKLLGGGGGGERTTGLHAEMKLMLMYVLYHSTMTFSVMISYNNIMFAQQYI